VLQRLLPFSTLIVLFMGLSLASPGFLTATNLGAVARQTAVINVMSLGMTLVIISGGIDLSVGSTLALSGLLGAMAMEHGSGVFVGLAAGLTMGLLCGLVNGLSITALDVNPFIITLGTMSIYRGLALVISGGVPVSGVPDSFAQLAQAHRLGIPQPLWIVAACAVAVHVFLQHTRAGRYAFAIGSNREAARYAGVAVKFHLTAIYAAAGLLTGLAGMLHASRLRAGQPTEGQGYELSAIAAVVIGGGSLRGGEGSVSGTLIGAFIMGLLANGSDLLGVNPYWQQVIIGTAIILAVTFDEFRRRRGLSR
jgi:ribose transport system permease protein